MENECTFKGSRTLMEISKNATTKIFRRRNRTLEEDEVKDPMGIPLNSCLATLRYITSRNIFTYFLLDEAPTDRFVARNFSRGCFEIFCLEINILGGFEENFHQKSLKNASNSFTIAISTQKS